ncbi:phosphoglycerol transferase MdoB-like AlkP superfamily enzyme [Neorhizobium galegae]|uniref:tripartite tricarboxylate transporter TctB family protein n=1 Tax=Neorhizobium TaxID=1525371 RepID=UPI00068D62E5|nr:MULTISPECIES: tripartite tricarboxylate transporter TctB family protein [Neorhizobium]MBP2562302.1 phosphoglycerol transferase MdoB-like AlkP superfamily enzyme [Neorhizobium galegae]MDQ0138342.1 phosphoglycerol transferase MdoB-like AlkP superfamily enzyme [Neorhizobium galegae]
MIFKTNGRADIEAGLFFTFFGAATAALSLQYRMGTIAAMGPGMFPFILGSILAVLGAIILAKGILGGGEKARPLPLRPTILISLSILVFAFLLLTVGLLVALPVQVAIAMWASEHFTWKRVIALSLGLLAFCYGVFVYFLGMSVPLLAV